jgi:hypothetical protein
MTVAPLHSERGQAGQQDHPGQLVAQGGAAGEVGREVTRVDVGDGGNERGPEQPGEEAAPAPRPKLGHGDRLAVLSAPAGGAHGDGHG